MRQILYHSDSTAPGNGADLDTILQQSRHNNALNGVTGLLWSDGARFLQVFEGPDESMAMTWSWIRADPRHRALTVLHDKPVDAPEFGYWSMALRRTRDEADMYDGQVRRMVSFAAPDIGAAFLAMIAQSPAPR